MAFLTADLHTIGGLPTLLKLLQDPEASVRWRAAEVVATCVQNNPPVQQVTTPFSSFVPCVKIIQDHCAPSIWLNHDVLPKHFWPECSSKPSAKLQKHFSTKQFQSVSQVVKAMQGCMSDNLLTAFQYSAFLAMAS